MVRAGEGHMHTIQSLLEQLRQPGARIGIGIWLLPDEYLGRETSLAACLNLHPLDLREVFLEQLPPQARFSGLTAPNGHQKLLNVLRTIVDKLYPRDCVLGYCLDLLLLGLEVDERQRFWQAALAGVPYPTTPLILTLPEKARALLPTIIYQRFSTLAASGKLDSAL